MIHLFLVSLVALGGTVDDDARPEPLLDALWEGSLEISVEGHQFTQYLTNNTGEGTEGFVKEKGSFEGEVTLVIHFLINALGEVSLVAKSDAKAEYEVVDLRHTAFEEEINLKKQRTRYVEEVKVSENTTSTVSFSQSEVYTRENFNLGGLRLQPSGRMDRSGSIKVTGNLELPISAEGTRVYKRERKPKKSEDPNVHTSAPLRKTILIPMDFSFTIKHRKDPMTGIFDVTIPSKSPFPTQENEEPGKRVYRNFFKGKGSYSLNPLFGNRGKAGKP